MDTTNPVELISFAEFVAKKAAADPDERIAHATWHSCAVGQYVETYQTIVGDYATTETACFDETRDYLVNAGHPVSELLADGNYCEDGHRVTLYDVLNNAHDVCAMDFQYVRTYGDLHHFITHHTQYRGE